MRRILLTAVLITFILQQYILGQSETYTVALTEFSSKKYDEFSPVYYNKGIVFCTNRSPNLLLNYSSSQNKKQFKIYYIDTTGKAKPGSARLFSKNLKSKFNDGPATFNNRGDTIYYSRNLELTNNMGNSSSRGNKLGIFTAVMVKGEWTKVREFRYNNERYNVTAPCLSPDRKILFFTSDKPGGFGGYDLYYCEWKRNYWSEPVNAGPVINTTGNESYPFINPSGDLFFSSDGHPGLGGMDIFFSQFSGASWLTPFHLDPPINSKYDDFGIITDTLMNQGYFSSNRNKSTDIYHFNTNYPQIFYSNIQKDNNYCFIFRDTGSIVVDTANLIGKWSFGDGQSSRQKVAKHCFTGPGNYEVKLDIIERGSGKLFFSKLSYNLEIRDLEQPFINSSDVAVKGDLIEFDGLKSYLPGFKKLSYSWDFGDGIRSTGDKVKHSYQKRGEYVVNLGITLRSDSTGNINKTGISKRILLLDDLQEKSSYMAEKDRLKTKFKNPEDFKNVRINTQYIAEKQLQQDAVYVVVLLFSKNKVALNNSIFKNVPKKYTLIEKYDPDSAIYCYGIDQQMSLMATYPSYREMQALGFKDTRIKMYVLNIQSEKELHNLIRINGAFADTYFDSSDKLTSNAYVMLDQIVRLMKKYSTMKLAIAVHTDNTGAAENNLVKSQKHSKDLVNYLIIRGINTNRLVATGFGGSKPIAPNIFEKDRKLNRRIDFVLIN
jgi:flagellar motor protein MotB